MINNQVTLFDISFYQDDDFTPYKVDFVAMKANGGDGVILRAGQNVWMDEDYKDYARNADALVFPRGAYWFYDSRSNPVAQADLFSSIIVDSGLPSLGIWGDYEENYGGPYAGERAFKAFMDTLRGNFPGKLVGVYTAYYYWLSRTTPAFRGHFKDYPLWIANYDVLTPLVPAPWAANGWIIWQYTERGNGRLFGAESSRIDMNRFNGTFEDYKRYFLLNIGEGEPMPEHYFKVVPTVATEYRSIRAEVNPRIDGAKVAQINAGSFGKAYINDILTYSTDVWIGGIKKAAAGDRWVHMFEANGVGVNGWCAEIHLGTRFVNLQEVGAPPTGEPQIKHSVDIYDDGSLTVDGNPIP